MPMEQIFFECPCCGNRIVVALDEGVTVSGVVSHEEAASVASQYGIELGALKGGEKVGN